MTRRPANPILARELRRRMRGRWTGIVLTLYLAVLGGVSYVIYSSASRTNTPLAGGLDPTSAASVGRLMFETLLTCMLLLVLLIVPGMTAGAIAGERERRTLAPLQMTLLSQRSIVAGKLVASLAFGLLLVVTAVPLVSVSYLVGGVTIQEIVRGTAMVLFVAITVACIALWCSSVLRLVQSSMLLAYALVLLLLVGTAMVYGTEYLLRDTVTKSGRPNRAVLVFNPLLATADVVRGQAGAARAKGSPLGPLQDLTRDARRPAAFLSGPPLQVPSGPFVGPQRVSCDPSGRCFSIPVNGITATTVTSAGASSGTHDGSLWHRVPFWARSALVYGLVCVACLIASARKLRTPAPAGMFT